VLYKAEGRLRFITLERLRRLVIANFVGDFRSRTGLAEMAMAKEKRRVVSKDATMIYVTQTGMWFDDSQQRCSHLYTSPPNAAVATEICNDARGFVS
jgi:hypothetical protein